jgi:uridine kinase
LKNKTRLLLLELVCSIKINFKMSKKKFNITNPESLIYQNEILCLTVLGGIKLEGLDRMRSTLKIELRNSSVPPVRHNLDLYNDNQTEKLIRKTAEKLEVGTSVIAASLAELTESLEEYRIEQIQQSEADSQIKIKELTETERKEAINFLSTDNLLLRTNDQIGRSGMIGEESNRLLMYLIFTSRKLNQPLHIVSLGASGTGKTHLQEKVGELIPEEDKIEITVLSENAFYYFGQRELKHKLILIEDLDGAESSLYPLRELQSKKRISKTLAHKNTKGETRTIHLVVEGPVSVSGCTTQEQIYEDNANRSFLIYLDESKEQDQKIMEYQRAISAGKVNTEQEREAKELLQNTQRLLQPIKVINPYAEHLQIPEEVLKPRRTNNHYLQFIEVVTYYHQFQREQKVDAATGEIFIETTLEDVKEANKLLKEILLRKSDELTGACRNYFEKLKLYLLGEEQKTFTNREMSRKLRIPITTVKRYHFDLFNSGYLRVAKKEKLKGYEYEILSYEEYKQLQEGIGKVLDNSLKNLLKAQKPSSPSLAQLENGLSNNQKIKKVSKENPTTAKKVS